MRKFLALLMLLALPVFGQVSTAPPLLNYKGTTLPTTCQVGRLFFDTDATAGSNVYGCTATNTWTLQGGSSGSTFAAPVVITGAANTSDLTSTGYSVTGTNSTNMIDLAGTWNTSGTPTLLKGNIIITAAGAAYFLDFQNSGVSQFSVNKSGLATAVGGFSTGGNSIVGGILWLDASSKVALVNNSNFLSMFSNGAYRVQVADTKVSMLPTLAFGWTAGAYDAALDAMFTRRGAATIGLGDAASATPVAQTLESQPSRSGTDTNTGGANLTVRCGAGTGTGTPCSTILQSYTAVASGTGAQTATTFLTGTGANAVVAGDLSDSKGDVRILPQNSQSAAYTTVLADSGKSIIHPSADTTARTWTIDSNANVPYALGTMITFVNTVSAGTLTIAITSDTMYLAGAGSTGSRTMTGVCLATAYKATSTTWIISGGSCLT